MERLFVDLIDFSNHPDGEFKYVLSVKDHCSKFGWASPLKSKVNNRKFALSLCKLICLIKRAAEVAANLRQIFHCFGPPVLLHTDNGGEFIGNDLIQMMEREFPSVTHVRGRPRHPQTQGIVERQNQVIENRIGSFIQEKNSSFGWANELPAVMAHINRSPCAALKGKSPFELMFLRIPPDLLNKPTDEQLQQLLAENLDETENQNLAQLPVDAVLANLVDDAALENFSEDAALANLVDDAVLENFSEDAALANLSNDADFESADESFESMVHSHKSASLESGESSSTGEISHMQGDRLTNLHPMQMQSPFLLFLKEPQPKAVAIAFESPQFSVHGVVPRSNQRTYKIAKILDVNCVAPHDPFGEPLSLGTYCTNNEISGLKGFFSVICSNLN